MMETYFARAADGTGPVKIGQSIMVNCRIKEVGFKVRQRLALLARIPGNYEPRFHVLFQDWHEGGEWFTWSEEMANAIAAINAGAFDFTSLPKGKRITGAGAHYKTHIGKFAVHHHDLRPTRSEATCKAPRRANGSGTQTLRQSTSQVSSSSISGKAAA